MNAIFPSPIARNSNQELWRSSRCAGTADVDWLGRAQAVDQTIPGIHHKCARMRNERFDSTTYPSCPGPLQLKTPDAFRAHGLYLKPGQNAVHTLYVVHHGPRESIEVFEVDARGTSPSLTWIGCAPALSIHNFNSVVALPQGGFASTNGGRNECGR